MWILPRRCTAQRKPACCSRRVAIHQPQFLLLDYLTGAKRAVVVDAVQTGGAPPGTVYRVEEDDFERLHGNSPHYVGLFETLELGRALRLPVPA